MIRVEIAYALPHRQKIIALDVADDCTALAAAQQSGIDREFPDIDWNTAVLGIFSKIIEHPTEQQLRAGDRIEIYRPLLIDPKTVRKQRAETKQRVRNKPKK